MNACQHRVGAACQPRRRKPSASRSSASTRRRGRANHREFVRVNAKRRVADDERRIGGRQHELEMRLHTADLGGEPNCSRKMTLAS